jgi:outer membrane protein assembly factor BamB
MKKFKLILAISFLSLLFVESYAQLQWRGINRDGIYHETGLLKQWPTEGPKMLWSYDGLNKGHTSVTVADNTVYTTGQIDGKGYLFAIDLNGKLKWKKEYGKEWDEGYPGSRTSPTFYQDKLYFLTAYGNALCFDAKTGKKIWNVDLTEKFGARNIRWGFVESPLIYDNKVIFTPGGPEILFVALNPQAGSTIWESKGNGNTSAYCSPLLFEHNEEKYVVTSTSDHIVGFNADNGKILWTYPQSNRYSIHPNTPIYKDGYILSVTGYGTGATMLKLSDDGKSVSKVWKNADLDNQMGGVVWIDDYIISSGHENEKQWQCLDAKTGKTLFKTSDVWKGNVIYADGMLYCYSDKGELALMKISSDGFKLVSKFRITKGTEQHWAHPVIKDGILYVRRGNTVMAFDIKQK